MDRFGNWSTYKLVPPTYLSFPNFSCCFLYISIQLLLVILIVFAFCFHFISDFLCGGQIWINSSSTGLITCRNFFHMHVDNNCIQSLLDKVSKRNIDLFPKAFYTDSCANNFYSPIPLTLGLSAKIVRLTLLAQQVLYTHSAFFMKVPLRVKNWWWEWFMIKVYGLLLPLYSFYPSDRDDPSIWTLSFVLKWVYSRPKSSPNLFFRSRICCLYDTTRARLLPGYFRKSAQKPEIIL